MKRIFFGFLLLLLLCSTAAVSSGWNPREWLPDTFVSWWWGTDTTLSASTANLAPLPQTAEAQSLLNFPHPDSFRANFEWPLTGVNPQQDQRNWAEAQLEAVLLQNQLLPLHTKAQPLLLHAPDIDPATFVELAQRFAPLHPHPFQGKTTLEALSALPAEQEVVIFADNSPLRYATNPRWFLDLESPLSDQQVLLVHLGNPRYLDQLPESWTALQLPSRNKEAEAFAAQVLFGAQPIISQLQTAIGERFPVGAGNLLATSRPGYESPTQLGFEHEGLKKIDQRLSWAIRRRTTPGAQLVVMHRGEVVLEKAYGHHTYRRREAVQTDDLYDLASITKAATTSMALMHLYDRGLLDLEEKVHHYLPDLKGYPAGRYRLDYLLTHNSGLQADLPAINYIGRQWVQNHFDPGHEFQIAPDRWLANEVPALIREDLKELNYTRRPVHRYSDVNYFLLQLIVEAVSETSLDDYVYTHFYEPMGLNRLSFRASDRFPSDQLVPSIYDPWMREATLKGFVHDESAALLGGVAGHAGLFGNARDLALLFQMLLDNGQWQGEQLIEPTTVELFTSRYSLNHRALGFDRLQAGWPAVVNAGAGEATFGHTGFSGTCVWADPERELVFVLLTNRIFPDAKNDRFNRYNVRGRVHREVYQALELAAK